MKSHQKPKGIVPKGRYGLVDMDVAGVGLPCNYCERTMAAYTMTHPTRDHVVPASRGGRSTVWCCYQCNQLKADLMPMEWASFMLANPNWWERKDIKPPAAKQQHICPVLIAVARDLVDQRYYRWRRDAESNPLVRAVLDRFPGAEIVSVKMDQERI